MDLVAAEAAAANLPLEDLVVAEMAAANLPLEDLPPIVPAPWQDLAGGTRELKMSLHLAAELTRYSPLDLLPAMLQGLIVPALRDFVMLQTALEAQAPNWP